MQSETQTFAPERPPARRQQWLVRLTLASVVAFVAVAALATAGTTQGFDDSIRQLFRPDDVWSTNQLIFGNVVDGVGPPVALGLLALAGLAAAAHERTIQPLLYVGLLAVSGVSVTVIAKVILDRPDPHGGTAGLGGALPSGHTVVLIVCLVGIIVVLRLQSCWWAWAVAVLVTVLMAVSLLFLAMHWFTDVVGGVLLAIAVVAIAEMTNIRPREINRDQSTQT